MRYKKSHRTRNILLGTLVVILLAGASVAWGMHRTTPRPSATGKTDNGINYGPPTKADRAQAEASKSKAPTTNTTSTTNTTTQPTSKKNPVEVTITTWKQDNSDLNINGFVAGVVEDGGTCTVTLTNGSDLVTRSRQAVANATNTSCGITSVPLSALHSGTWNAILTYSSSTSEGTSSSVTIKVT